MASMAHLAMGGGVLLASFFGAGKRYMGIAAAEAHQINSEIRHDLKVLEATGQLENRPPTRPLLPRKPVKPLLLIGGTYAGSAFLSFMVWFAVLFPVLNALQNSVDSSQPAGATALGSFMFAFMIAVALGLFGLVIPGIPLVLFFAFKENTKRAKEEVAKEFYRPYWQARTRQLQYLATNPPANGAVHAAAIAAAELEQYLVTDTESANAI